MPIEIGARLGPYEVIALIGIGGMGEVYRARDTKLKRDVALKVLPDALSNDSERVARFRREAQVLATLNHPNIAALYGLEESASDTALVMEMVEGKTLSGPIPVTTALDYARQIAGAFEAAHEKGIIHRDLKPANVKVTPEGVVKVLDFGLATIPQLNRDEAVIDPHNSPTLTLGASQTGVIMGTAAYMSPEQAAGKAVDKRCDIWSFGVVLFEMLTGRRLFEGGDTISHALADVLRAPIELDRLPSDTPPAIRNLIGRCLDRDVKNRLRDIGEARVDLAYLPGPGLWARWSLARVDASGHTEVLPAAPSQYQELRMSPDGTRVALMIGSNVAVYDFGANRLTRLPFKGSNNSAIWALDGKHIAFRHSSNDWSGPGVYWIRADGAGDPVRLLDQGTPFSSFSFSPDGKRLAYTSGAGIWTLPLNLTDPDHPQPGKPELFLESKSPLQAPVFSPDGRWIAYTSRETQPPQIFVSPFPGAAGARGRSQISTDGGTSPLWSRNGRELFYIGIEGGPKVATYTTIGDSFVASQARLWSEKWPHTVTALTVEPDLMPDGKHFLVVLPTSEASTERQTHVTFLLNFADELRRRFGAGK